MAIGYLRSRVFAAFALLVSGLLLAASWDWIGGLAVAVASLVVLVDGLVRLQSGIQRKVWPPLFLDMTAAGLAILLSDLPPLIVVVPLFYDLVSAVFALGRRDAALLGIYGALWSVAVIRIEVVTLETNLSPQQEELALLAAVLIYSSATFLMTSSAADAVRERENLNIELRENESRLQAVVDSTPIVLYAIDNDGTFTLSEGPGLRSLGLEPGQVVGLNVNDVYADHPNVLEVVNEAQQAHGETVHEIVIGDVAFSVRHRPQQDSAGNPRGIVGVAIDVTTEANYRAELEALVRSKDEFVASVSHELRTPLSVVFGLSEELSTNHFDLSPADMHALHELLAQEAREVVAIVEDLLVAARADIDRLVVVGEPVDIDEQVTAVLQPVNHLGQVPVQRPAESVQAFCDASRTRQILRNLVANAVRHGGENVGIRFGYHGSEVLVEVRDDGDGVPEGDEQMIFDAYHRSPADSANPASIGLGLTVARKLARLMNGDLTYERRDGWSIFRLTLPAAKVSAISD